MAKVIKRTNVNPWGQTFGVLGQGIGGFTDGMMAKKMLDMWGKMGEKITPPVAGAAGQPVAAGGVQQPTTAAQPAQNQPTAQGGVDGQASGGTIPMPQNYDEMLRALIAYKNPYDYTYTG